MIGVYEPVIVVNGAEVRETSRAAEPDLPDHGREVYHRACYVLAAQASDR